MTNLNRIYQKLIEEAKNHEDNDYFHYIEDALGALENAVAWELMKKAKDDERAAIDDRNEYARQHALTAQELGVKT